MAIAGDDNFQQFNGFGEDVSNITMKAVGCLEL
jgi:hypothetical protein